MRSACWRNKCRRVYPWILAVLLSAISGLCLLTIRSSDDFWYSTFLRDGIGAYIGKMVFHYQSFNGRVWVHILAHVLLWAGNWLFALVCAGCCLGMPFAVGRAAGLGRSSRMKLAALFLILVAAMPTTLFVEGILWISAFCNYLVPSALLCVMLWQLERGCALPWLLLSAFLCGSATEQIGMTALAVLALYVLGDQRERGKRLAALAAAALGLVTVFASPATGDRALGEIPLNSITALVGRMGESFNNLAYILTGSAIIPLLLALLLVLCSELPGSRAARYVGWGGAALAMGACLVGTEHRVLLSAMVLTEVTAFALWMFFGEHRLTGGLLLTALASVAVMLPTSSVGCRNLLPCYLLISLAVCYLAVTRVRRKSVLAAAAALTALLSLVGMLPLAQGVLHNYRVDRRNREYAEAAAQTGVVCYDSGYDLRHTYSKAFESVYLQTKYLESMGFGADTPFALGSTCEIRCADTLLEEPGLRCISGIDLLPLRPIVESLGGSLHWQRERLEVELNGIQCRLYSLGVLEVRAEWTDADGTPHRRKLSRTEFYESGYYETALLTEVFGLDVTWDAVGRECTIRAS